MTKTSEFCPVPAALDKRVAGIRTAHIDLDATDMAKGRGIAREVREALARLAAGGSIPALLPDQAFIGGSFGRRTQAQPLDDVDIFIPLDASALTLESPGRLPTAEQLVAGSTPSPLGCQTTLHSGDWLDSGKTIDHIVAALPGLALAYTDVRKNRRGRCAYLDYKGINVDLVFVLWSLRRGMVDRFHLPSGAGPTWRTANPKDDQERLSRDNQNRHGGLLLPVIRTLKAWNDHVCRGRLKSIHLEVLALERIFADVQIDSVTSAVTYALGRLPDALSASCPDPTGLGPDLDVALHPEDRLWVRGAAQRDAARAAAANQLGLSDVAAAADEWASLLLTDGPAAPDRGPRAQPEPGRHDREFGQPAHHCPWSSTVPPPKAEYRPVVPVVQQGRSGKYA
jgi:hypothetical protein